MLGDLRLPLWWLRLVQILISYISQGSVAASLRFDGIFIDHLIVNFLESMPAKEFLNSVNI